MSYLKDLTGQKFGKLTVISRAESNKSGRARWNCICDCGNYCIVLGYSLQSGNTKSCGCLHCPKIRSAGLGGLKWGIPRSVQSVFNSMHGRCYNPRNIKFKQYGGRSDCPVGVCDTWHDLRNFASWYMSQKGWDDPKFTLDRIDGRLGYSPENCRLADIKTQNRNTKRNIYVDGKCLSEWCEMLGIERHSIQRYAKKHSCSLQEALSHFRD